MPQLIGYALLMPTIGQKKNSIEKIVNIHTNNAIDIIIAKSFIDRNGEAVDEQFSFDKRWEGEIFNGTELFINLGYGRGSVCGVIYSKLFLTKNNISFPENLKMEKIQYLIQFVLFMLKESVFPILICIILMKEMEVLQEVGHLRGH